MPIRNATKNYNFPSATAPQGSSSEVYLDVIRQVIGQSEKIIIIIIIKKKKTEMKSQPVKSEIKCCVSVTLVFITIV